MKLSVAIGLTAVALFLAPGFSHAGDYCITFPASGYVVVGRGFAPLPTKGKCKAWTGFSAQGGNNSPSTGVGCTSSDGSHFNLMFTTAFPATENAYFEEDQMSLALPAQTGNDSYTFFSDGTGVSGGPVTANGAKCSMIAVPAIVEPGSVSGLGNYGY